MKQSQLSHVGEWEAGSAFNMSGSFAHYHFQFYKVYRAYYDELVILLGTGLRISELCGLTIADVGLEKNIISVDHQLLRTDKIGRYAGDPKTRCGIRQVYMGPEVQEAFRHVLGLV